MASSGESPFGGVDRSTYRKTSVTKNSNEASETCVGYVPSAAAEEDAKGDICDLCVDRDISKIFAFNVTLVLYAAC
jgi:hypothetical protein